MVAAATTLHDATPVDARALSECIGKGRIRLVYFRATDRLKFQAVDLAPSGGRTIRRHNESWRGTQVTEAKGIIAALAHGSTACYTGSRKAWGATHVLRKTSGSVPMLPVVTMLRGLNMKELSFLMLVALIALGIAAFGLIKEATDTRSQEEWTKALVSGIACLTIAAALLVFGMVALRKGMLPTSIGYIEMQTALRVLTASGVVVFGVYGLYLLDAATSAFSNKVRTPALVSGIACLTIETVMLVFGISFLRKRDQG